MIDAFLGAPTADSWRTYSPVLRAKTSEWLALQRLTPGVRQRIAPIVEFIPDWDTPGASTTGRKRRAPQTPAEYVTRVLESSMAATPAGTRSFVYFGLAHPSAIWSGIDLWSEYAARVPASTRIVPLADLSSLPSAASLPNAARSRGELGLRLRSDEIGPQLASRVAAALRATSLDPEAVHIIVDLKGAPTARSHAQVRDALGYASPFASVVVLAGVFPQDLSKFQYGLDTEPRTEWQSWWLEHTHTLPGERLLGFGDYTTQHAHYHVPPEEARGTVSLRYTVDDAFLVLKGRKSSSATGFGHSQMHGHCRLLVARPDYCGPAFSNGDHVIQCWTNASKSPGSYVAWRTASFVHHITHVVTQLHDPSGSSATARQWARAQSAPACP